MTPELRICPFCGGEAVLDGEAYYWVKCSRCKAETRGVHTKQLARDLWNRRVGEHLMERMVEDGK